MNSFTPSFMPEPFVVNNIVRDFKNKRLLNNEIMAFHATTTLSNKLKLIENYKPIPLIPQIPTCLDTNDITQELLMLTYCLNESIGLDPEGILLAI